MPATVAQLLELLADKPAGAVVSLSVDGFEVAPLRAQIELDGDRVLLQLAAGSELAQVLDEISVIQVKP